MNPNYQRWQKLFLFGLGIFIGTAFCMKWLEDEFIVNGEKFTIIGLEITYPREKVTAILSGIRGHVASILRYHLSFDFAFMAGVYPGIAALCMMARWKSSRKGWRQLFFILAALQTVAWGCDITENIFLLRWIENPVMGDEFMAYHIVVIVKWVIALAAVLLAVYPVLRKSRK